MKINRVWSMPSAWTFTIKPIKDLLNRYANDWTYWVDPFAGKYSPAGITNDINPEMPATWHLDALEFFKTVSMSNKLDGILFDPPYSYRQISEHYKAVGRKVTKYDTSSNFYSRIMNACYRKIRNGGYAISFGWNSNGFGKKRGFEIVEILLVAHGGYHNDTICVVEKKIVHQVDLNLKN